MPSNVVARRRVQSRITRYAPVARAGMSLVRKAYGTWKQRTQQRTTGNRQKGTDDAQPLYGTTFTSKVSYRAKRPRRRRVSRAKRSFGGFLRNAMKLQNAQNALSANAFISGAANAQQSWSSVDVLNASAVFNIVLSQLPSGVPLASAMRDFTLYLKTFTLRWYMTNTGANPLFVDLYHVIPRRDITYGDVNSPVTPTNGNVLANLFTGNYALDALPDTHGDAQPTAFSIGAGPFQSTNFTRMFKIVKVRALKMAPGETFEERDTVLNRRINLASFGAVIGGGTSSPSNIWYKRGMSKCVLYRVRGAPGLNSGSISTALPCQLSCSWEETSVSKVMQTKPSSSAVFAGEG